MEGADGAGKWILMNIKELHLLSNDLSGTRHFYHENFGIPLVYESREKISVKLPGSLLHFHFSEKGNPQYHVALTIPSNRAAASLEWLKGKSEIIPVEEGQFIADFRNWNAESVYFFDNNRNIMEFIGRRDLNNATEVPFDSNSILAISEVGLVTRDVSATCQELQEQYGIGYFTRQPPGKHFAASGDDAGLFIVVTEHRNWYPTEIPSALHWLKITFVEQGKEFQLEKGGSKNY